MKKLFTIAALFMALSCSAQYGPWQWNPKNGRIEYKVDTVRAIIVDSAVRFRFTNYNSILVHPIGILIDTTWRTRLSDTFILKGRHVD